MKTARKYRVVKLEKPYVGVPIGNEYALQFSESKDENGNDCWEYLQQFNKKKKTIWAHKTFIDAMGIITSRLETNIVLESERFNPLIRN